MVTPKHSARQIAPHCSAWHASSVPQKSRLTAAQEEAIRNAHSRNVPIRTIAREVGTSPGTVLRALSRIVDRTRTAEEFKGLEAFRAPQRVQSSYSWDLAEIRGARDAQLRGHFQQPVRLAESMRTDDALFVAYHNRIAPQSSVQAQLTACAGSRGLGPSKKAAASVQIPRSVLAGIHGTLANHGIAIGYNDHEVSDDGTRTDFKMVEWPLEHVKWNASREVLETRTRDGQTADIVHGDGRWSVFRKFYDRPWTQEACILPGSFIWATHAEGLKDWAMSSASHGLAKMIAELPEGVSLQVAGGGLSPEAQAILTMLQDMLSGNAGVGIRPAGSKTEFIANNSSAWQIFLELILNREKAAARVYLGTDAILGATGGAPGVDISALFGVATTKLQGDFWAIEQGVNTGVYQPWAAVNYGDSSYAPGLVYQLPDPDAAEKSEEQAAKRERLHKTIKEMKAEGMIVDQKTVDALCKEIGIETPPQLASGDTKTTPIDLAPADKAKIVRVGVALRSMGLEPFGDARDGMTITELDEANKAKAEAAKAEAEAAAGAKADIKVEQATPPAAGAPAA